MYIKKIKIENFKCFWGQFTLDLNERFNILVGDNESGKSTILEAINLALSGWIYGKYLKTELTQSLFNNNAVYTYLQSLSNENPLDPPNILIELYLEIEDDSLKALYEGNFNSLREKACGFQFRIQFNENYQREYEALINTDNEISSLPIEYYDFSWISFARDYNLTPKLIPLKSALIDSSNRRYQSGSDVYISRIIRDLLTEEHKVKIAQAHRKLKDNFAKDEIIKEVNKELKQKEISEKEVELSVDMSTKSAWETNIMTYLDKIPFSNIGRGEQCLVKTKLALSHKKANEANVLLLEEPENHLSYSKLNKLLRHIKESHKEKQIIVSTHSSFVANKLGLGNLILLNAHKIDNKRSETRITDLNETTKRYFEKLAGFDTLRLILCEKAILVEGPSDELIVQKAYMSRNQGKLPIEDGIDVISVGTSFLRFLEIAEKIKTIVAIVTDNDGNYEKNIKQKYHLYEKIKTIEIFADQNKNLNTLEPQIVNANKDDLDKLREILELDKEKYSDEDAVKKYMEENKTDYALKIFESDIHVKFPPYILDAIGWIEQHE